MQVQHECQLIESVPLQLDDITANTSSKSIDAYCLSQDLFKSINFIVCSPVTHVIALHSQSSNQIVLYDTKSHQKRDRFPLKACDKRYSKQSFTINGLDFSPDGQKLAIGQTDCIIYIYKLTTQSTNTPLSSLAENVQQATSKPVITGKFACSSPITCLVWTELGIIFGTHDGKVKLIQMFSSKENQSTQSTKVISLYSSPNGCPPIALQFKAPILVVSFVDGTILAIVITFEQLNHDATNQNEFSSRRNSSSIQQALQTITIDHSCPPHCLTIIQSTLCCAGSDGCLTFHTIQNEASNTANRSSRGLGDNLYSQTNKSLSLILVQTIDLKEEIVAIDYSSINENLIIITKCRILFAKFDQESSNWRLETSFIEISRTPLLSSVAWIKDGTQFVVGTSNGSVELFRCIWSKHSIGDQLDICHIARNRVRITDRSRNLLATYKTQTDIKRVNILDNGQSVIIWTSEGLLLARLELQLQSEIRWPRDKATVKFSFEPIGYVLIYYKPIPQRTIELSIVRLGDDSIIYSVKAESLRRRTISLKRFPPPSVKLIDSDHIPPSRQLSANIYGSTRSQRVPSVGGVIDDAQPVESSPLIRIDQVSDASQRAQRVIERLVYVTFESQLNFVDLMTGFKQMFDKHDEVVVSLKLSNSGEYVVFKDAKDCLYLVKISIIEEEEATISTEKSLMAKKCEFYNWLPETNILVAQNGHKIFIWYELTRVSLKSPHVIDIRSLNIHNEPLLIDLSLMTRDREKSYPIVTDINNQTLQLTLSNDQLVQLDRVKVKFYADLMAERLESALELLDKESRSHRSNNVNHLWSKLGWWAISKSNSIVALKAFERLNYNSLCRYLRHCIESAEEGLIKLAQLSGNWNEFERLADQERVIATYRRLNKWSNLLGYLTKLQQFRQRDIVEREFQQWLIDKGRLLEAARLQATSIGDLTGAIELLMKEQKFPEACDLFVAEQKRPITDSRQSQVNSKNLLESALNLRNNLVNANQYSKAALLTDKVIGDRLEALDFYIKGEDYESALSIAQLVAKDKVPELERLFGRSLINRYEQGQVSRRIALRAIDHLLAGGEPDEALKVSIGLNNFDKAFEILDVNSEILDQQSEEFLRQCKQLGEYMQRSGNRENSLKCYRLGRHHDKVVDLELESNNYDEAFKISLIHLHNNNKEKAVIDFIQLANSLASTNSEKAESIYLLLERYDLAIEMHKEKGQYDRMLELIKKYQSDRYEGAILQLARQLESESRYQEAERYLLKASESEWTNVVRMYRLANKWSDAYRVARSNCVSDKDPLLVQLAYWWAKSLAASGELGESRSLLGNLNVLNGVVEFCCENKNFQFAIDLSKGNDRLERESVRRFASHLESESKFERAEEILLKYNLIELAARMYLDNGKLDDAIRVLENNLELIKDATERSTLTGLLDESFLRQAQKIADEVPVNNQIYNKMRTNLETANRLQVAQQMFLRAQRPDLAIDMYKKRNMWQEAIQVAQRFAPRLLESVERALDDQVTDDIGPIIASINRSPSVTASITSGESAAMVREMENGEDILPNAYTNGQTVSSLDQMRLQIDEGIRSRDWRGAQQALIQYLNSLMAKVDDSATIEEINLQLEQLEKLFEKSNKDTELKSLLLDASKSNSWARICILVDLAFKKFSWGEAIVSDGHLEDWIRVRNVLEYMLTLQALDRGDTKLGAAVERRLLIAHYVVLQGCLIGNLFSGNVRTGFGGIFKRTQKRLTLIQLERLRNDKTSEPLLTLLYKLSMSLLRYSDSLEARRAHYSAGLWSLAADQIDVAHLNWKRMIELEASSSTTNTLEASECHRTLAKLVDLPEPSSLCLYGSPISSAQLSEVRQWMLESIISSESNSGSLLGGGDKGKRDSHRMAHLSLVRTDEKMATCLISGRPIRLEDIVERKVLGQVGRMSCEVLRSELRQAKELATSNKSSHLQRPQSSVRLRRADLANVLEFLARLTGCSQLDDA